MITEPSAGSRAVPPAEPGPRTIGLVIPSFEDVGGVGAVAEFILRAIARRPDLQARVISLATAARDPCSLLITDPRSWRRGVSVRSGQCHGEPFTHVGARFGELEFQRLAPRRPLARLLEGCDLIQVVAGAPSWALPVVGLGKPVVLQVATLTAVERRRRARQERGPVAIWRAGMTRIAARLDARALRAVDAILVENPWMKAHAEATTQGLNTIVHYAPPGVDIARFRPASPGEPLPPRRYILAVGRFSDPRKNPLLLLRAYGLLVSRLEGAPDLVLAGTHDPGPGFWALAASQGLGERVRFEGEPDDARLAALYRRAFCLALPSDEEGFGMVVIEAMASGVPVVSTRCGGPEAIITDGVDGYLVDRDDAAAMADRLARLAQDADATAEMGRRTRLTVETRFADTVAGDAFLAVYDRLLATSPRT